MIPRIAVVCVVTLAFSQGSGLKHVNVFTSGTEGYAAFRIPAIETAANGNLLAFAEARKNNMEDPGFPQQEIDLVMKYSTDGGETWSATKLIEHSGTLWSSANPATVVDRSNGRVWLFYLRCKPGRSSETARPGTDDIRLLARYSGDNGMSWSEPADLTTISRDMNDREWRLSVPGPGGAIQDQKGRLVLPMWKVNPWRYFVLYSNDHGKTWQRGQVVPGERDGNEDQVVELADGSLLLDVRQNSGPHRWMARSTDGGLTWSEPRPGVSVSPVCCAIERFGQGHAGERNRIIWTGPRGPERKNLILRVSHDEGKTFPHEQLIAAEWAAYSDLTILKDGAAGILWERGVDRGYQYIAFTRITRNFLDSSTKP